MKHVQISDVTDGTELYADDAFTCLHYNERVIARARRDGTLYVPCSEGEHGLDGQETDEGTYIGLSKEPWRVTPPDAG